MRRVVTFDMPLFLCVLILVGLGIAFIYTASYPKAMALAETGSDAFFYTGRQILFAVVGLLLMLACAFIRLEWFYRPPWHPWFFWGTIIGISLLLIAVLVIGDERHGNRSWLWFFQPSEFAKVAVVVTLAAYLARRPWSVRSLSSIMRGPLLFLAVPVGFIALQKDLGTAFVMAATVTIILMIAGVKLRYVAMPIAIIIVLMAGYVMTGHRVDRIDAWRDPENRANPATYQVRNGMIATASGGLFGRGFCQSRQKWFYLPAAQNDSIMAIIAEEMGFLLTVLLLFVPYGFLVFRGFVIAHRAPNEFGALLAVGCTVTLATQALINIAVVMNVIPMMGINLPFISYGGSSVLASMMMAGLLMNVASMQPEVRTQRAASALQPVSG